MRAGGLILALALSAARPTWAAEPGGADCQRNMDESSRIIRAIQARDRNPGIARGDTAGMCRLLRQNEQGMARARNLQAPCLTGFNRRETLAQFDANLIDIKEAIAMHCR